MQGNDDIATTWEIGGCGTTIEPTNKPTSTPKCPKDYIFTTANEEEVVTKQCPFGWRERLVLLDIVIVSW